MNETLRCGLQTCAAQDALWEVVGKVVVNYCEQHSIFFAADLGASCARIDWAGGPNEDKFCFQRLFQRSIWLLNCFDLAKSGLFRWLLGFYRSVYVREQLVI